MRRCLILLAVLLPTAAFAADQPQPAEKPVQPKPPEQTVPPPPNPQVQAFSETMWDLLSQSVNLRTQLLAEQQQNKALQEKDKALEAENKTLKDAAGKEKPPKEKPEKPDIGK